MLLAPAPALSAEDPVTPHRSLFVLQAHPGSHQGPKPF